MRTHFDIQTDTTDILAEHKILPSNISQIFLSLTRLEILTLKGDRIVLAEAADTDFEIKEIAGREISLTGDFHMAGFVHALEAQPVRVAPLTLRQACGEVTALIVETGAKIQQVEKTYAGPFGTDGRKCDSVEWLQRYPEPLHFHEVSKTWAVVDSNGNGAAPQPAREMALV